MISMTFSYNYKRVMCPFWLNGSIRHYVAVVFNVAEVIRCSLLALLAGDHGGHTDFLKSVSTFYCIALSDIFTQLM